MDKKATGRKAYQLYGELRRLYWKSAAGRH